MLGAPCTRAGINADFLDAYPGLKAFRHCVASLPKVRARGGPCYKTDE